MNYMRTKWETEPAREEPKKKGLGFQPMTNAELMKQRLDAAEGNQQEETVKVLGEIANKPYTPKASIDTTRSIEDRLMEATAEYE